MFRTFLKFQNPFIQLFSLIGIMAVSVVVFSSIAILLSILFFDVNLLDIPDIVNHLDNADIVSSFKFMQLINHISLFIIPSLLFAYLVSSNKSENKRKQGYFRNGAIDFLQLRHVPTITSFIVVGLILLTSLPLINGMVAINEQLTLPEFMSGIERLIKQSEENAAKITEAFLKMDSINSFFFNIFFIAIIPGIGEELLFRGVLQPILIRWTKNTHVGIWVTAFLFSAFHLQFFGFLPRMMLGVLFGYLLVWSNSLWLPIFGHFVNNGAAVILAYLMDKGMISEEVETIGTGNDEIFFIAFSAVLVTWLIYLVYKKSMRTLLDSDF